ncbi:MAG TPA: sigma 54-interacting transcriptional regulator [Puia sp.]|nr:sigma 54-interacting transcriptional regulator [Puia sp.]
MQTELLHSNEKQDLLRIIRMELRTLQPFGHNWVAVINEDGYTLSCFVTEPESLSRNHPLYQQVIRKKYPFGDGVFNRVFLSCDPVVFSLRQLAEEGIIPEYLRMHYESGISRVVMTALQAGTKMIGVWVICLTEGQEIGEKQLGVVKHDSRTLAAAVANVRANEEIQRRETELSILLSLSTDIASVRNDQELLEVIKKQLKGLLGFTHTIMATFNKDEMTVSAFLLDPQSRSRSHPEYAGAVADRYPLHDGVLEKVFTSAIPLVFDLGDLLAEGNIPRYLRIPYESGSRQVCIARLLHRGEVRGFWIIYYDEKAPVAAGRLRLIEGLANQISVAVSNIIANDVIARHLDAVSRQQQQLEEEKIYLQEEIGSTHNCGDIITESSLMKNIFRLVGKVAPSESTVLILGETGTGKELIARAIHSNSPRRDKMMVKVNCAALPANLIESELFGHERGSFTGAYERRIGKFELANEGTLFLDEIGEMPLELQVKLLRALQEKEIERVGGKTIIKVNVRIIAATNRDLEKEMLEGRFRSDLYYRLNIFPIQLPPLRQRREDIPLLAAHFIRRHAKKTGKGIETLSSKVLQEMMNYDWPGNIRELEHLLERSVLLTTGDTIRQVHLPVPRKPAAGAVVEEMPLKMLTIEENEREHILAVIRHCRGRISGQRGAAEILGVPATTLNSRMKRLGIKKEHISRKAE